MKKIISEVLVLIICATSLSSAQLNKGLPRENEVSRIVNGQVAEDGQFPYQVRLIMSAQVDCGFGRYLCGGSIIAKNWVMTAGHCVTTGPEESHKFLGWEIQAGEILINQPRQRRIVLLKDAYPHPNYNSTTLENDIGLLRTKIPFDFSTPYVQPIPLVFPNVDKTSYVGKNVTVSGFGLTTTDGFIATQLLYTTLIVVDFEPCYELYFSRNDGQIPATSFCAENIINNSSTCNGDSGGPVTLMKDGGKLIQIGIVSFGSSIVGCNESPNGFTDVTEFIPWIHKTIYGYYLTK